MNQMAIIRIGSASAFRFALDAEACGDLLSWGRPLAHPSSFWFGANDGGVKRGDRADTGDNEAQPTGDAGPEGSGVEGGVPGGAVGHPTGDSSALGGGVRSPKGSHGSDQEGGTSTRGGEGPVE